jgi:hypothetical protein
MMNIFWTNWLKRGSQSRRRDGSRTRHKPQPLRSRRLGLERLEDRTLLSVTVQNSYTGLDTNQGGGFDPPDTQGAAGTSSVVETVNQSIAIYSPKDTGTTAVTDTLDDFWTTQGGLSRADSISVFSDPVVVWDEQIQRFIVADQDVDGHFVNGSNTQNKSFINIAVSTSDNPTTLTAADWHFFQLNTTETSGGTTTDPDYPGNLGWNHDSLVLTLNMFDQSDNFDHVMVTSIDINSLVNGTPLTLNTNAFQSDFNGFGLRPTVMHDAVAGGPMWLVQEHGDNSSIDVVEMTNVLSSSPTFTTTQLAVTPYSQAVPPLQPDGSQITVKTDSRIQKAAEMNGILVTAHQVANSAGTADLVQWYVIDLNSGTPTLSQQGDITGGPGTFDMYPAIDINAQGQIGMTYIQSGTAPGQFMSMYVTGRTPADALGTMEAPVLVSAGTGTANFTGSREGDLSALNIDSDGTFWAINEFANGETSPNWGTAVAHFTLTPPVSIVPFSATEGQPLTSVPVATFTDKSGAALSSYVVTISWGDGATSAGQVVDNGNGNFTVLGSHTYTEEGQARVTVTVSSDTRLIGSASGIINVADAPLQGFAQAVTSQVGAFISNALVAVFTDSDQTNTPSDPQGDPADYTATIQWFENDGLSVTTTGRIVPLFGNTFGVVGDNNFSLPSGGLFTIRVVIRDVGGASVTVDSVLNVAHNPAIPPGVPMFAADTGPITSLFAVMEDALTNLLLAERLFLESVAFGTLAQQQHGFSNLINAFFAYQAAVFSFDMSLPGSTP